MSRKFILVCDERGTKSWSSRRRTFALGGFAMAEMNRQGLINVWEGIKHHLCGKRSVELKWSDFFPGHHQKTGYNPLRETDSRKWGDLALWALERLFNNANIFPITAVVRKDRVQPNDMSEQTRKGKTLLSMGHVIAVLLGQFALYLEDHQGLEGELWHDRLSSLHEESQAQEQFSALFANLSHLEPSRQQLIRRVSPTIRFLSSASEPAVQVADFVSGVIWAAAEGDEKYLLNRLDDYAPGGKKTYGIAFIES